MSIQERNSSFIAPLVHFNQLQYFTLESLCSHLTTVIPKDKFPQSPYVLVSSKHTYSGRKHDAATVWAENIEKGKFTVCLREMQNFDGMHENITVVSTSQFCILTQSTPFS